jgi:transmembrane sensor
MKNIPEHIERLMVQYLNDSISESDQSELKDWLAADGKNQEIFEANKKIWESSSFKKKRTFNVDRAWDKVSNQLNKSEKKVKVFRLNFFLKRAAAILVICALGIVTYLQFTQAPELIDFVAVNKVGKTVLTDSSIIALNKNSVLTYPELFDESERRVKLKGVAFFKVTHNKKQPFVIEVGEVEVTVLGTEFYIQELPESNEIKVSVGSGKVSVRSLQTEEIHILTNKESINYSVGKSEFTEKSQLQLRDYFWHNKILEFKNESLEGVFVELENKFNVSIDYPTELVKCRFSSRFHAASAEDIIKQVCLLYQLNYSKKSNYFKISGVPNC